MAEVKVKQIQIPYSPRTWAKTFHSTDKKRVVLVLHRRCGKTVASINHLVRECFRNPEQDKRYAYIAPTYKQAKQVAWDILKKYAGVVPRTKFNEAELRCDFPNGSRITLYGADNPDSLRGIGLWGVVFDEYSQQPSNIYSEIILPALADHNGFAIWIGTPKGKNDFHRLFKWCGFPEEKWMAKTPEERIEIETSWLKMKLGVSDTKILSEEFLKNARQNMTEDEYNQEFECSFESSLKGAYYGTEIARAYKEGRIKKVPHEPVLPVITAWDWGMNDSTSIGFFQHLGNERRMIDYYESSDHGIDHYARVIFDKPYVYENHLFPHDFNVRDANGVTRIETAESLGLHGEIVERQSFNDGINAVRMIFSQLYIDEDKCGQFVDAISQYQKEWDNAKGEFKDKEKHDWTNHAADMLRYYAEGASIKAKEEEFEELNVEY